MSIFDTVNFQAPDNISGKIELEKTIRQELTTEIRKEREELQQAKSQLELHKQQALGLAKSQSIHSIKLNVGGTIFEIESSTVNKFPHSTLGTFIVMNSPKKR